GLRLRPLDLQLSPELQEHLAEKGYDPRYGARPLKRALERELLTPLAEALNEYAEELPLSVEIGVADQRIKIAIKPKPKEDSYGAAFLSKHGDQLAESISEQRRLAARLKNCSATSALENQATLIESLERRVAGMK